MSAMPSVAEHIRQLEEQMLRAETRRSGSALGALLADDFVEFASDGRMYTKAEIIAAIQCEAACLRSLAEFRLVALAESVVLATYRAARRDERSGGVVHSLRSSVWAHRERGWQLVFHQGTRVAP